MKVALISQSLHFGLVFFLIICCPSNVFIMTFLFLKVINTLGALSLCQKRIVKFSLFSHMYAGNRKLRAVRFLI